MDDFINEALEIQEMEILNQINPDRRPYTIAERIDHFDIWDDLDFVRRFRLKKGTVERLLQQIEHHLLHRTNRNNCVTPMAQLLLTLRFYASGSLYVVAADFVGVSKATAGKIISRVTNAIASLRPQYIALPNNEVERNNVIEDFYRLARFPRTIGAIDCTHIRIQSPGGNLAENYRNRKGYFSVNVQVVCDAQLKFIDIVARWPGASHDSNIFDHSGLRAHCENGELGNAVLVGDSGYAVRTYLITPLPNPQTPAENLFNEAQIRTRNVIERAFGVWKRRFPILSVGMRCRIPLTQAVIVATAVLHNLARMENEELPPDEDEVPVELGDINVIQYNPPAAANAHDNSIQRQLVQYFANLL